MNERTVKLMQDGSVVIPEEYRQALGLHLGDELIMRLENGEIHIAAHRHLVKHAQELIRQYIPQGRSLSDELLAERRSDR